MKQKAYSVEVHAVQKILITVYADSEEAAEEKAANVVSTWKNVIEVIETTCQGETQ